MNNTVLNRGYREFHGFAFCEQLDRIEREKGSDLEDKLSKQNVQMNKRTWDVGAVVFLNTSNMKGKGLSFCKVLSGMVKDMKTGEIFKADAHIQYKRDEILSLAVLEKAEILTHTIDAEPCDCTAYETLIRMKLTRLLMTESKEEKALAKIVNQNLIKVALEYGIHSESLFILLQAGRYQKLMHHIPENEHLMVQNGLISEWVSEQDGLSLIKELYGDSVSDLIDKSHKMRREGDVFDKMSILVQILSIVTQYSERRLFGFYHDEIMGQLKRVYGDLQIIAVIDYCLR